MNTSEWPLHPGEAILRTVLHDRFGGGRQGGISPSRQTSNVFIFSDPRSGERHGYIDNWQDDGCFHYTGEGQRGDQVMKGGNAAMLNHKQDGRALRLFQGVGGMVSYVGEFEVANSVSFYTADAPETDDGPIRSVIVFRLLPKDTSRAQGGGRFHLGRTTDVKEVEVEEQHTERMFVEPAREPYEAERREATLVRAFRDFLSDQGHKVTRLCVLPEDEAKPLFSDLYVRSIPLLVEAKGTVTREAVRMALGQLIDYARFVPRARLALLLPTQPRPDLMKLIQSAEVELYWQNGSGFEHVPTPGSS